MGCPHFSQKQTYVCVCVLWKMRRKNEDRLGRKKITRTKIGLDISCRNHETGATKKNT